MVSNPKLLADDGQFYPNEGIFRNNAPLYWAVGLPVFPLEPRSKAAKLIKDWTRFAKQMPEEGEKAYWLQNWPDCNIGLPLGPQSGCVAIDIDTEDERLIKVIESVCGPSPWERVGKKGKVLLYKYNNEPAFKIKDVSGKMICECLSIGNQVVMPPSIHPDTQKPYRCNVPLPEVYQQLRPLPLGFEEILRNALKDAGVVLSHSGWTRVTDYVSQGSRDVKMTAVAGLFANSVTRGELTLLEAIDRLRAWKATCVENVAGDDIDIEKGVRNLIRFLIQDVTGPKKKTLPPNWDAGMTPEQKKEWGLEFAEDNTEWMLSQMLDYLNLSINPEKDDILKIQGAVDFIINKIQHSPSLTPTELNIVYDKIHSLSKRRITKSAIKEQLKQQEQKEMEGTDHTEVAEAVVADYEKIGQLKYWHSAFYQWKGSNWEVVNDDEILRVIAKEYGHLPACRKASDHRGVLQVMRSLLTTDKLNTADENGINFANGYLTQDGVLCEHAPQFGCTYTLPYRYIPELANHHPKFDGLLERVWGHCPDFEQRKRALQEAMCATVFGMGPSFSRAILLYGIGGSGKSQILDIVRFLLPENVVTYISPYGFDDKYKVTELSKSLLNVCGELDANSFIPDASFKSVVDGSSFSGQYKFGQLFSFSPKCTHWFASNHLPKSRDTSAGFFRRWLILHFDRPVPTGERIRNYGEKVVAEEREGIMAWVASVVKDLAKQGDYTLPESHNRMIDSLMGENDSVFFYLKSTEGPKKKEGVKTELNRIYEKYTSFCYAVSKSKPVCLRVFLTRMTELSLIFGYKVEGLIIEGLEV